ncbi:hypothetical protein RDI58_021889 [Solanum bulbocastanum]|uniref:Uncharacterized protein n=1 Tax=Solanum bulbocastanum TaxID=147425 RepID=A0AAN8T119_SOLBU
MLRDMPTNWRSPLLSYTAYTPDSFGKLPEISSGCRGTVKGSVSESFFRAATTMLSCWRVVVLVFGRRVMEGKRKEVLGSEYEEKEGVFWEEKLEITGSVEWGCVRNEMLKVAIEEKEEEEMLDSGRVD